MTSWAASSPRTFLNDPNRNRFSVVPPAFENNRDSVGPCAYHPRLPPTSTVVSACRAFKGTYDGVPEREKEIYGTPVSKLVQLPNATAYSPRGSKTSPFDLIVQTGERPQFIFTSTSRRDLWPKNDITAHPEEYPPGPAAYGLPDLGFTRPRSPAPIVDTREVRESNSPVEKEPLPSMITSSSSRLHMYAGMHGVSSSPRTEGGGGITPGTSVSPQRSPTTAVRRTPLSPRRQLHGDGHSPVPGPQVAAQQLQRLLSASRSSAAVLPGTPSRGRSGVHSASRPSTQQSPRHEGASAGTTTFGTSPRHFNIVNINSKFRRERDPDYDNPPPGAYDLNVSGSLFSPNRRGQ